MTDDAVALDTTPPTPWQALPPDRKTALVRDAVQIRGRTYHQTARELGTSRLAIAGVVERAKRTPNPIVSNSGQKYGGARGAAGGSVFAKKTAAAKARERKKKQKHAGVHRFVSLPRLAIDPEPVVARADVWLALPGSSPIAIEDHTTGCRFPVGADLPFFYCDLPVKDGSVYCPHHDALCHRELPVRRAVRKDVQ